MPTCSRFRVLTTMVALAAPWGSARALPIDGPIDGELHPSDPRYADPPPPDASLVPMGLSPKIRDGFCFKVGAGGTIVGIDRVVRNEDDRETSSVRAAGAMFELFVGGSIRRDTALGALFLSQTFGKQTLDLADAERTLSNLQFGFLGAALRHYFWSDLGLSASLGIGFTTLSGRETEDEQEQQNLRGLGGGATLSVGYDFWLGDELALGAEMRGLAAGFSGRGELEAAGSVRPADDRGIVLAGAIAAGLTYY